MADPSFSKDSQNFHNSYGSFNERAYIDPWSFPNDFHNFTDSFNERAYIDSWSFPSNSQDFHNSSNSFNGRAYIDPWSFNACQPNKPSIDESESLEDMQNFQNATIPPDLMSSTMDFDGFPNYENFQAYYPISSQGMDDPHLCGQREVYPWRFDTCTPNMSSSDEGRNLYVMQGLQNTDMHQGLMSSPMMQSFTSHTNLESENEFLHKKNRIDVLGGIGIRSTDNIENTARNKNKKTNMVKRRWKKEEDMLLKKLVGELGDTKWPEIAKLMQHRTTRQCRERWQNNLRPDIKTDTWTIEEHIILIEAHKNIGNSWGEIAKRLPGRTENSIKNLWYATKRRRSQSSSMYPKSSTLLFEYIKNVSQNAPIIPMTTNITIENNDTLHVCDIVDMPDLPLDKKVVQSPIAKATNITKSREGSMFIINQEDLKIDIDQAVDNTIVTKNDLQTLHDNNSQLASHFDNLNRVLSTVPELPVTTMESTKNQMFLANHEDSNNCVNQAIDKVGVLSDNLDDLCDYINLLLDDENSVLSIKDVLV